MKFLKDIEVQSGLKDSSGAIGSAGQVLSSTGSLTSWIDNDAVGNYLPLTGGTLSGNLTINNTTGSAYMTVRRGSKAQSHVGYALSGGSDGINWNMRMSTNNNTLFFANDSGIKMSIKEDGNIGIGTSSPTEKLSISGAKNTTIIHLGSTNNDSSWSIGDKIGAIEFGSADSSGAGAGVKASISYEVEAGSTGATNSMVFRSAGTTAGTNNTERMRITASGNVGIGTDSPSSKLSIINDGAQLSLQRADAIGPEWKFYSWGSGLNIFPASASEIYIGRDGATTNLQLHNGILKVLGTGDSYFTGSVGIGTTIPNRSLVVQTNESSYGSMRIYRNSETLGETSIGFFGTATQAQNQSWVIGEGGWGNSGDFVIGNENGGAGGNVRLLVQRDGNVGIGTISPSEKLEVAGKGLFTGTELKVENDSDPSIQVSDTDANYKGAMRWLSSNNVLEFFTRYGGTYYTSNLVLDRGNVGIGTISPSQKLDVNGNAYISGQAQASTAVMKTYSGHAMFGSNSTAEPIALGRDAANLDLVVATNGNVGIGTTNPLSKLQVNSIAASTMSQVAGEAHIVGVNHDLSDTQMGTLNLTSTSRDAGTNNQAFGSSLTFSQNASKYVDGYEVVIGGIKTELMYTGNMNKSSIMNFYTHTNSGLTPKMSIDADGNVGIGTTSPVSRLHAIGEIVGGTTGFTSGMNGFTGLGSYDSSTAVENIDSLYLRKGGTNGSSTSIAFGSAGGDDYFVGSRIKHIRSGSNSKGHLALETKGDNSTNTTSERMRITDEGNVGIGATNPLRKLHVVGNFAVNAGTGEYYGVNITGGESANPNILIGDWHNSSANIKWDSIGNYLRIDSQHGTNGAPIIFSGNDSAIEYMRITSAGDVGIGSTAPQARLDVQPTASNRKVTRIANDVMSTYFYNTQADAVLAWTCGSYYQAEVVITANQTNGGDYNNIYIRGIWSNNHTSHHWDELERVGSLSGSTFTMSVGQNGATENSGRLELDFDYINGSFSQLNVRVTDFYGTHSYTIT